VQLTFAQAGTDRAMVESMKKRPALQDWPRLSHDLRDSSRLQAAHIFIKLRALGYEAVPATDPRPAPEPFTEPTVLMLAKLEHERWNAERWVAGWVYAEQKSVARRRNPNLVPWAILPPHIQQYDLDAVRLIPTILAAAGMKIIKQQDTLSGPPTSP
jgi:hypothetical protein